MIRYIPLNPSEQKASAEIRITDKQNKSNIKAHISLKQFGNLSLNNPEKRREFFKALNIEEKRIIALKQKHSKKVILTGRKSFKGINEGDGMITDNKGAVLTVTVADCLPIYLFDKQTGVFGLLHSGWKGTGIVKNAVYFMAKEFGTHAENLAVTIGPGIGSCCYRVPESRFQFFRQRFGKDSVRADKDNHYYLDLRMANIYLLKELNVQQITVIKDCTFCNKRLSSFRRDGKENLNLMLATIGYY
jgi:YfiH family protein